MTPFYNNPSDYPALPLSISSNSLKEALTCPSYELSGRPLGLLHSMLSLSKQPDKQDQLLGNVPHAHITGVDIGRLSW